MDINKYKQIVNKTAIYPQKVDNFGKLYTYLGLIGEFREMQDAYTKCVYGIPENLDTPLKLLSKEIGDVIWYVTAMSKEFDITKNEYNSLFEGINIQPDPYHYNSEVILEDINDFSFDDLAEKFKKYYRDGKEIPKELIINKLRSVCNILGYVIAEERFSFNIILEDNYNKLIKRRDTNTLHGDGDTREEGAKSA